MLNLAKFTNENLLSDLSAEAAANINGGQAGGQTGSQTDNGKSRGKKYLQALGAAYLLPPGIGRITDDEALLAQYIASRD
jgi:hypothetical protein